MAYVYRYIDKADDIIKYVGIVWDNDKTLDKRIYEHTLEKRFTGDWKIEYVGLPSWTRTDVEMIEAHLISLYQTYNYLNRGKVRWGISRFIVGDIKGWKEYVMSENVRNRYLNPEKIGTREERQEAYYKSDYFQNKIDTAIKNHNFLIPISSKVKHLDTQQPQC